MRSRSTSRLVTVLLLLLAAFGIPSSGSAFAALRLAQVTICAVDRQPSQRCSISQPPAPRPSPRRVRLTLPRTDDHRAGAYFFRERFQRPPPRLFSLA